MQMKNCKKTIGQKKLALVALALVCGFVFVAPAHAQNVGGGDGGGDPSFNVSPPPERLSVTETGVDIRTGRFAYSKTDLEIGSLNLVRQLANDARGHVHPFGNLSHNWDIFIAERRFNMTENLPPIAGGFGQGDDYQLFVHYGGSKQVFNARYNSQGVNHSSSAPGELKLVSAIGSRSGAAVYRYQSYSDGTILEFRPMDSGDCSSVYRCAYVSKIIRANGEELIFSYDTGGGTISGHRARLAYVRSSLGFAVRLEYTASGSWHKASKACVFNLAVASLPSSCSSAAIQTVTYGYQGGGSLRSVTDAGGAVWQYGYPGGGRMEFYHPGEAAPYLTNTRMSRQTDQLETHEIVTRQVRADGLEVSYQYEYAPYQFSGTDPRWASIPELAGGTMTTNVGTIKKVLFDFPIVPGNRVCDDPLFCSPHELGDEKYQVTTGPARIVDELGRTWVMDWCDAAQGAAYPPHYRNRCLVTPLLESSTDPEGAITYYKYDGWRTRNVREVRRVAKSGSSLPDVVTQAGYNCFSAYILSCSKPIWTIDASGNRTDFEYSPTHGGILKQTAPADASGVRPETRYSYAQKYAWIKNSGGGFVQAASPVWVLVSEEYCRTSAADVSGNCGAGASDEVVTTYEYQAGNTSEGSNVWLIGTAVTADGQTLRTCYGYDENGRRISETQPKAGLASCQ
ncbi:MAG: hypothetical protein AAF941_07170 [Pseudomonadota bacterium]